MQLHNVDKIADNPPRERSPWHYLHVETTRRFLLRHGRQEKRGALVSVDKIPCEITGLLRHGERVNVIQEYYHIPRSTFHEDF